MNKLMNQKQSESRRQLQACSAHRVALPWGLKIRSVLNAERKDRPGSPPNVHTKLVTVLVTDAAGLVALD
jgi:hypothetical protein